MNDSPEKNFDDEKLDNSNGENNGSTKESQRAEDSAKDDLIEELPGGSDGLIEDDLDDTDKYLAIEQPGVQFTDENNPTRNSDQLDYSDEGQDDLWSEEGGNSKNSEAFNQDDYILDDNVDLDEDQNQSISSDDDDFEESNERYTN
jgi:hypothetical protein